MTRAKGCLVLFILSVIAGGVAGFLLISSMEATSTPINQTSAPQPPASSNDSNRSVLVLGVDNLEKPAQALEGAWVVTLVENADGIIFLKLTTLYPVVPASMSTLNHKPFTEPHPPIMIDPDNLFGAANLAPISFTYQEWSHVILLDEIAINTILMMQNLNFTAPVPTPGNEAFTKPWDNPQLAFEQQGRILTLLCDNPTPLSDPKNINLILGMEGTHITSTLPEGGLKTLWQLINYVPSKQVICSRSP